MTFIDKLPKNYNNLPYNGKRIFEKFYNRSLEIYKSKKIALKLANCAVRKKYMYLNNIWYVRPDANDTDTTSSSESDNSDTDTSFSEDDE
ncbi:ChaB2 [Parapoynx stagnalis nucleopolyhedrovirus]|uniref:ChaB2 n=1 Tax=Parapoynx stagnalis nucleopolyhedrovirus TaxID=2993413 RepID=A0A9E7YAM0_9ABAC|nr:ChaB2 [Parapoynx stagnalis nucleopolyhedrovirus]